MKVILYNGSFNPKGCTNTALEEVAKVLQKEGIETEILCIGSKPIRDCIACGGCAGKGKCVFNDDVANEWIEKAKTADGFVFGSPVYYAHASGRLLAVMDRMFYAGKENFKNKPACAITVARRAGTTNSYDDINKYFGINNMPQVSSSYWNMVFGRVPEDIKHDEEGLQTMRNLALNMAWLLKSIEAGKKAGLLPPQQETTYHTNFVR